MKGKKEINAIDILKDSTHYPQLQATILDKIKRNKACNDEGAKEQKRAILHY